MTATTTSPQRLPQPGQRITAPRAASPSELVDSMRAAGMPTNVTDTELVAWAQAAGIRELGGGAYALSNVRGALNLRAYQDQTGLPF